MHPVIETRNLSKVYGKKSTAFLALSDINLTIHEGESVAIVGKSGSGKSTLMHLLALLDTPSSGTIKIDGTNSTRLNPRKLNRLRNRRFGFVFQQFFMNSHDTVLENVLLPLKISGTRRRTRKKLALDALKTVELDDKAKNKANDLSGGQKQRVCIARAIVNNPKVLFADEPTGNLDSATGERIIDLLFSLNREKGVTLIIVTHDDELASLCDRQIRIMDGKIVSDQTVEHKSPKKSTPTTPVRKSTGTPLSGSKPTTISSSPDKSARRKATATSSSAHKSTVITSNQKGVK